MMMGRKVIIFMLSQHTLPEVAGLAALICWSHLMVGHFKISEVFPTPFLSLVGCDLLTPSLCENISS